MTIAIIADVHLSKTRPYITKMFVQFTKNIQSKIKTLYILGDLFEAWPGDDYTPNFVKTVKQALRTLTKAGVNVYFMRGNHDFLIGKNFLQETGIQLIKKEPFVINVENINLLLMHGDLLFTTYSWKYRLFRAFTRHPFITWLTMHILSLKNRLYIANYLKNDKKNRQNIVRFPDNQLINLMKKYHVCYCIYGHLHKPLIQNMIDDQGKKFTQIILGAWGQFKQNVLLCYVNKNSPNQLTYRLLDADKSFMSVMDNTQC